MGNDQEVNACILQHKSRAKCCKRTIAKKKQSSNSKCTKRGNSEETAFGTSRHREIQVESRVMAR